MPPSRGEVWLASPPRLLQGREQRGPRPVLVISVDEINYGPAGLSVVVPITSRDRGVALHVPVEPPEGGFTEHSVFLPEQIHAAAQGRLTRPLGRVTEETLGAVADRLRTVLGLDSLDA